MRTFRSTAIAVLAFGVAMGYLEAAVVVYLRAALGLGPPGLVPTGLGATAAEGALALERIEVVRELATVVMIATVGWLAGRSRLERLAWASVVFGTWDIVYYGGLRLTIGWPPAPDTWDVLFLVPVPWVGPVWAPIIVSAALVLVGLAAAARLRAGGSISVGPAQALAGLTGGGLVVASFLIDEPRVGSAELEAWTGWPLFWLGMLLAAAAALVAFRRRVPAERIEPAETSLRP